MRSVWIAIVCLLVGAIFQAVVAWACLFTPSSPSDPWDPLDDPGRWRDDVPDDWPERPQRTYLDRQGFGRTVAFQLHDEPMHDVWLSIDVLETGLPLRSLRFESLPMTFDGFGFRDPLARNDLLPRQVMPGGLAANTLLYGASMFAVFWCLGWVRRWRRRRRGQCVVCRYDRAGLGGVCPECGAPA